MRFIAIIFCITMSLTLQAQLSGSQEEILNTTPDTIGQKTEKNALQSFKSIFEGEPGRVFLTGILVPGGGQIYNKDYWKAPIVWAAEGTAIGFFIYNRNRYLALKKGYYDVFYGFKDDYQGITNASTLKSYRDQFRLDMERLGFVVVAVHLLGAMEAFTSNHLKDFEVNEDLSFQFNVDIWKSEVMPDATLMPKLSFNYIF